MAEPRAQSALSNLQVSICSALEKTFYFILSYTDAEILIVLYFVLLYIHDERSLFIFCLFWMII